MQTEAYSALVQTVLDAARSLKPNEAIFLPSECVVARSSTGKVRFGSGNIEPRWLKGDGEEILREHVAMILDRSQLGYFATRNANELRIPSTLRPVTVENVGRRSFRVVYEPSEAALIAMNQLDCEYVDWEGRPYGAMDCLCSDGRHILITGTGEIRETPALNQQEVNDR